MSAVTSRVVRFNSFINPVFDERLRSEAGIELQVHPMPVSQALANAALQGVHAYHVSAAKDEQPPFAFVTPTLIAACPDLLCASSAGAGYDPIDVAACTRAGIAVVNQTGGNAVSVGGGGGGDCGVVRCGARGGGVAGARGWAGGDGGDCADGGCGGFVPADARL